MSFVLRIPSQHICRYLKELHGVRTLFHVLGMFCRYVLKNMVRDWAAEGAAERAQSYGRIIKELQTYLKDWPADRARPRVLIPGCGLARLCVETAALGCEAEVWVGQ
jgi:hypothetical protein